MLRAFAAVIGRMTNVATRARLTLPVGSGRLAPHQPERRAVVRPAHLLRDAEPMAFVERAVALGRRLEVGGQAVAVAALEDRTDERRADPATLVLRRHAED